MAEFKTYQTPTDSNPWGIESCESNVRWLPSIRAYLSQPHMNMCGRPRICIRGWYD